MKITLNKKTFRTPKSFSMGCQKKILQLQESLQNINPSKLTVAHYEALQEMACTLLNDKPFEKRNPCQITIWMFDEYGDDDTWSIFLREFLPTDSNDQPKKKSTPPPSPIKKC